MAPSDSRSVNRHGHGHLVCKSPINVTVPVQGMCAFENTQSAAAFHEAGHCVISQSEDAPPTSVRIWSEGREWVGRTEGASPWRSDNTTTPEEDLRQVRLTYAGVMAEQLFDPDYRIASSLDEIITAMALTRNAAIKLRRNPQELLFEARVTLGETLLKHKNVVHAIAEVLMREERIGSEKLAKLLNEVEARHAR